MLSNKWTHTVLDIPSFDVLTEEYIFQLLLSGKLIAEPYHTYEFQIAAPGSRFNDNEIIRCRSLFNSCGINYVGFTETTKHSPLLSKLRNRKSI